MVEVRATCENCGYIEVIDANRTVMYRYCPKCDGVKPFLVISEDAEQVVFKKQLGCESCGHRITRKKELAVTKIYLRCPACGENNLFVEVR